MVKWSIIARAPPRPPPPRSKEKKKVDPNYAVVPLRLAKLCGRAVREKMNNVTRRFKMTSVSENKMKPFGSPKFEPLADKLSVLASSRSRVPRFTLITRRPTRRPKDSIFPSTRTTCGSLASLFKSTTTTSSSDESDADRQCERKRGESEWVSEWVTRVSEWMREGERVKRGIGKKMGLDEENEGRQ